MIVGWVALVIATLGAVSTIISSRRDRASRELDGQASTNLVVDRAESAWQRIDQLEKKLDALDARFNAERTQRRRLDRHVDRLEATMTAAGLEVPERPTLSGPD